jgi:hypothetical protein
LYSLFFLINPLTDAVCQDMQVPIRIQAATFSKVFKYDSKLKGKNPIRLLVVYNNRSREVKEQLLEACQNASIKASAVIPEQLENRIKDSDVVYFMPGTQHLNQLCKKQKKLSIAGLEKYAKTGQISIALGLHNDKPRLYVNITSLMQEDHNLSANLLKIVQVYK